MLEVVSDFCPYCGEKIDLVVDCSELEQEYTEDCSVCCRPIVVTVTVIDDGAAVSLRREDET
ncbi:CPXCG motif-containing cysteine-rich protein [Saccharophagus sp. K07]|mgnify:CR=1 FL=1|jgi:hypothetical protein|uniref:CPXCG motif-containing cysteine-rich protein n=1 Tax=Saccharophagus sp. K07 TaxID=2283636 RepID=UPI00165204E9|nr:CPXCG motif-containing cysteine-rich protein [Saccharophagus sp. K07]